MFSGANPELNLVEMIELNNHPHFVGCPEFKSGRSRRTRSSPGPRAAREHREQQAGRHAAVTKLAVGKSG